MANFTFQSYAEDNYLQLSGIQHFAFCPRQWALIHIEDRWVENYLTASGRVLHNKVHNDTVLEKRGGLLIARGLKVSSRQLGISGECDVVEFHRTAKGFMLKGCQGHYIAYPVEYKRGVCKVNDCDRLQLCAQAMCLEEMLNDNIPEGSLYYGKSRRREVVTLTVELREKVKSMVQRMHELTSREHTPQAIWSNKCNTCSLKDECVATITRRKKSIEKYLMDGLL